MSDDILLDVKDLIDDGWTPGNTNDRTPRVSNLFDNKRLDIFVKDQILIWELISLPEDNASGGLSKSTETTIVLDIRTGKSRAQVVSIYKELERILNDAQINVFGDGVYDISDIIEKTDKSDKSVGLFRIEVKWRLEQFNVVL